MDKTINLPYHLISKNGIVGIVGILLRNLDRDFLANNGIVGSNGITVCFCLFYPELMELRCVFAYFIVFDF